ncbi:MAG: mycothiol synthase [Dermatophilaceae bacterium]
MIPAQVTSTSTPDAAAVLALAARAEAADGVAPLSEAYLLTLAAPPAGGTVHLEATSDSGLVGYAQVDDIGAAELVVSPEARRQGIGGLLWQAARAAGARTLWAHGDLDPARAAASSVGLVRERELHRMERALTPADTAGVDLPPGFSARTFVPGADDEAWVALNATAFAAHPEQGRLTVGDLHQRMAQPWFSAAGFFLVTDDAHPEAGPIAFHWTKVAASDPSVSTRAGEVYAVGVHPAYQGRGLARPLTRLGTQHLATLGLATVELYVDGDNSAALATYRREGFASVAVDAMYAVP